MKNILAAFALISSVQPVLAQDLECVSSIVYVESLGLMNGTINIESSFTNDFDKPISSVNWTVKNLKGKKMAVAETYFLDEMGWNRSPLGRGKSQSLTKDILLRTQHQGLEDLSEEEKEIMRDNFEKRVEKKYQEYSELVCGVVRVNFANGTTQKF
jgi:hypothetical protein